MGKEQEPIILTRYLQHQKAHGHANIAIENAGFLVDKELGWLGASPDAVVEDADLMVKAVLRSKQLSVHGIFPSPMQHQRVAFVFI